MVGIGGCELAGFAIERQRMKQTAAPAPRNWPKASPMKKSAGAQIHILQ